MSNRQYHRTLAFTLLLSAGAWSLPRAEAAPGRSGPHRAGAAVQEVLFSGRFFDAVKSLWDLSGMSLKDDPSRPADGRGPHHGPDTKEGPGACPHGHM